ncbi:MAG: Tetratricopeptide repeat protein [Chloroflexi bacterium OLB14]|nr:MAG: Tetratricopeptide repeat protein [Chloroflexi bacterium OLB14]
MSDEHSTNKRFDNAITILIASVAIWVSITAFFQNHASNRSDQARRRAEQFAIESVKSEVNGTIQASYEWQGAYQTWYELDLQITAAEQIGDSAAAERYALVQQEIIKLSHLLGPQYFDANSNYPPNYSKFVSDSFLVKSTRLSETYLAEAKLGNETNDIADALIVQITMLTVALSLYGLSLALAGRVRWLFVIVGSGMVGFCMLWLGWCSILWLGLSTVNETAINAYAEGYGLAYQARDEEAIEKFTAAIQADPYYAAAYYQRGLAHYYTGDISTGIADVELARTHGLDDASVNWNLGWMYYLSGQYDKAIETNNRILNSKPEVIGVRSNQALNYLVLGDLPNAQIQFDLLIKEVEKQVIDARQNNSEPPASLWVYLDASAIDLTNLLDELNNKSQNINQAPPANLITGNHESIREFALAQAAYIKEVSTSLEYLGQLPAAQASTQITSMKVGNATINAEGFIDSFTPIQNGVLPYGNASFDIEFTYAGAVPSQLVWKVYINGREDQALRKIFKQDISQNNTWYQNFGYDFTNTFILADGEYLIEVYADGKLVGRTAFSVR